MFESSNLDYQSRRTIELPRSAGAAAQWRDVIADSCKNSFGRGVPNFPKSIAQSSGRRRSSENCSFTIIDTAWPYGKYLSRRPTTCIQDVGDFRRRGEPKGWKMGRALTAKTNSGICQADSAVNHPRGGCVRP